MSMQGVAVPRLDDLMNYMITWVNELQATSTADTAHRQFGWVDDTCTAFIVGKEKYRLTRFGITPVNTDSRTDSVLQTKGYVRSVEEDG